MNQGYSGGAIALVVIGIICAVAGAVTGSTGTAAVGVAIVIGALLLLRFGKWSRRTVHQQTGVDPGD